MRAKADVDDEGAQSLLDDAKALKPGDTQSFWDLVGGAEGQPQHHLLGVLIGRQAPGAVFGEAPGKVGAGLAGPHGPHEHTPPRRPSPPPLPSTTAPKYANKSAAMVARHKTIHG